MCIGGGNVDIRGELLGQVPSELRSDSDQRQHVRQSSIQRALRRHRIEPLVLQAQFLDQLLENLHSDAPRSEILTGTAGDGKTYHCRQAWIRLGGSETPWNTGNKIQRLELGARELIVEARSRNRGRD